MAAPQAHRRSDIVASIGLDTRPLQSGLTSASRSIEQWSKTNRQRVSGLASSMSGLGQVTAGLGSAAASSLGQMGSALSGVAAILSGGLVAAVGIGIGALITGVVRSVRRTREAREHMAALAKQTGVTAEQVDRLERAFANAGREVERIEAQQIAEIAQQAGVSTAEVERLTDRIVQLATLRGVKITSAAQEVIRAHGAAWQEVERIAEAALAEEERRAAGVSAQMMTLARRSEEALGRRAEAERELAAAQERAALEAARASTARAAAARAESGVVARMYEAQATAAERAERKARDTIAARREEIAALDRLVTRAGEGAAAMSRMADQERSTRREQERAREALEAEARARARRAAAIETEILAATAAHDQEAAAVWRLAQALASLEERRKAGMISAEDARRQAEVLAQQHEDAVDAIARHMVDRQTDAVLRLRAAEAALTDDLILQAQVRAEAQIEQLRRRLREEERLAERTRQRLAAAGEEDRERIQAQLDHEVSMVEATREEIILAERAAGREIDRIRAEHAFRAAEYERETALMAARLREDRLQEVRLQAQAELAEVDRLEEAKTISAQQAEARRRQIRAEALAEQARITEQERVKAVQAGTTIGQSIVQGVRSVTESDEWTTMVRSILAVVAAVASIVPGGQLAGQAVSAFAGFFSHGGHVRGPGGPREDRVLARVSPGEYIVQASAVQKLGLPAMEEINQGRIPRFADGGLVGGGAGSLAGGGGSRSLNVTINTPGTFLTREVLRGEVLAILREAAIVQEGAAIRTIPDTRRIGRR